MSHPTCNCKDSVFYRPPAADITFNFGQRGGGLRVQPIALNGTDIRRVTVEFLESYEALFNSRVTGKTYFDDKGHLDEITMRMIAGGGLSLRVQPVDEIGFRPGAVYSEIRVVSLELLDTPHITINGNQLYPMPNLEIIGVVRLLVDRLRRELLLKLDRD